MRKYEKASKGEMASAMKKIIEYMKGSVGIVAVALVLAAAWCGADYHRA